MNINIDYQTRTPIYEQIVKEVERLVTLEILKPGDQIFSIRELACTLSINPNTVKKAYDILQMQRNFVNRQLAARAKSLISFSDTAYIVHALQSCVCVCV